MLASPVHCFNKSMVVSSMSTFQGNSLKEKPPKLLHVASPFMKI